MNEQYNYNSKNKNGDYFENYKVFSYYFWNRDKAEEALAKTCYANTHASTVYFYTSFDLCSYEEQTAIIEALLDKKLTSRGVIIKLLRQFPRIVKELYLNYPDICCMRAILYGFHKGNSVKKPNRAKVNLIFNKLTEDDKVNILTYDNGRLKSMERYRTIHIATLNTWRSNLIALM